MKVQIIIIIITTKVIIPTSTKIKNIITTTTTTYITGTIPNRATMEEKIMPSAIRSGALHAASAAGTRSLAVRTATLRSIYFNKKILRRHPLRRLAPRV
jgi:hypothetical protein